VLLQIKLLRQTLFARRRGLVRYTAAVAVAGIAIGVACLIVALVVARSFQQELRDKILGQSPHIAIFRNDREPIEDPGALERTVSAIEGVVAVTGSSTSPAVLIGPGSSHHILIRTIEMPNDAEAGAAEIGFELAANAGIVPGDVVELMILEKNETPRMRKIRIRGTFKTGLFEIDSNVIRVSPPVFAAIFGDERFAASQFDVRVADAYAARHIAFKIRERSENDLRVLDWQEANEPLFAAMTLERRAAVIIISLIVLLAVFNISTTLTLLVNERRLDIAILRTCGARLRSLVSTFVIEGLLLGLIGTTAGIILGLAACELSNYFEVFRLDQQVYSVGNVRLSPGFYDIALPSAAALFLCTIAAIYPAFKAARTKPMENLRNG